MKPSATNASATRQLDLAFVRACFPAFARPLPAKTAFFENAGGSYVAATVLDKLLHFYRDNKVQPSMQSVGASEICTAAGKQMEHGRQTMAALLDVPMESITLGPSTTQNINTLAIACTTFVSSGSSSGHKNGKRMGSKTGSKIIVSEQDHEANIGAWERLCQRTGAELCLWEVDPKHGELSLHTFQQLLDSRVKIVCMTHSSNIVGMINPVEEVIDLCHKNGTRVILDGVSYAPHHWPNLAAIQPDAYCFSTYKTYATHLGVMYVAPQFAEMLDPQCHYFNRGIPEKRLDAAGPDHASIAALAGLGEYFAASYQHHFGLNSKRAVASSAENTSHEKTLHEKALAISKIMHQHEQQLCAPLLEAIQPLPLRVIGQNTMHNRNANIALVSERHTSKQLADALAQQDIAAGHGHFYAKRLLESVGVKDSEDGVLRISFSHYNTEPEVNRVIDGLRGVF